jgi:ArsR family transcriptional regulator
MEEVEKIFKALSDSSRLRIIRMLQEKSLCVCEIREVLQLANSTVSQHLSILKDWFYC